MQRAAELTGVDVPQSPASPEHAPFAAVLLDDELERTYTAAALLARLARPGVRVIRMGRSLHSGLTLERILVQVAGPEGEVSSGDDARRIVDAIAERQGQETRVVLAIEHAERLHPKVLRSLQAMAPYFVQNGRPTLQVLFVGRPAFRALLASEEMMPLREALGLRADPRAPHVTAAGAFMVPESETLRPALIFPPARSGAGHPTAGLPSERERDAARPWGEAALGSDGAQVRSPAAPSGTVAPAAVHGRSKRLEPTLAWPPVPLPGPSAAKLAPTPGPAPQRGRSLARLLVALAIFAGVAVAASWGLHRLFYRDLPAGPLLSAVIPASPAPLPPPPPAPSMPPRPGPVHLCPVHAGSAAVCRAGSDCRACASARVGRAGRGDAAGRRHPVCPGGQSSRTPPPGLRRLPNQLGPQPRRSVGSTACRSFRRIPGLAVASRQSVRSAGRTKSAHRHPCTGRVGCSGSAVRTVARDARSTARHCRSPPRGRDAPPAQHPLLLP